MVVLSCLTIIKDMNSKQRRLFKTFIFTYVYAYVSLYLHAT